MPDIFRYSRFYTYQPYIAIGYLGIILLFMFIWMPGVDTHGIYPWVVLICCLLVMAAKCLRIVRKRKSEPREIHLKNDRLSAIYGDGGRIDLYWDDIAEIQVTRKFWSIEFLLIKPKDESKIIVCNSQIAGYDLLKPSIYQRSRIE